MLCILCNKNMRIKIYEISIGGEIKEVAICDDCVIKLEKKDSSSGISIFDIKSLMGDSLKNVFDGPNKNIAFDFDVFDLSDDEICRHCGTTYQAFLNTSLMGCSYCYETFEFKLRDVLHRIQRGPAYLGRKRGEVIFDNLEKNKVEWPEELEKTSDSEDMNELNTQEEINQLLIEQKEAVENEDYLKANEIKNKILILKEAVQEGLESEENKESKSEKGGE